MEYISGLKIIKKIYESITKWFFLINIFVSKTPKTPKTPKIHKIHKIHKTPKTIKNYTGECLEFNILNDHGIDILC